MRILSINTSTNLCSVSIFENGSFNTLSKIDVKDHTKYLSNFTREALNDDYDNLDFIAVSVGPGSYAGLRTSISFCKGLSMAIKKPIVPVNNFLCMNSKISNNNRYYICIYSHRDFVYSQLFDENKKVSKPECIKINKLKDYKIYGCGLETLLNDRFNKIKLDSEIVGEFAIDNYKSFIEKDLNKIVPIYLEI